MLSLFVYFSLLMEESYMFSFPCIKGLPQVTWNSPVMFRNLAEDKLLSLKLPPLPPAADDGKSH